MARKTAENLMNFVDAKGQRTGKASFNAVNAKRICFPCGAPGKTLVKEGSSVIRVLDPKPVVEFNNHQYSTEDPEIARGLASDKENFAQSRWGWDIEIGTLPEPLREIYQHLPPSERREVVLALIDAKTDEEAFDAIDQEVVETAKIESRRAVDPEYKIKCPVCAITVGGDVTAAEANGAMTAHIHTMHPEYKG